MKLSRQSKLMRNFQVLFWLQALRNFKLTNIIIALFYISRDLTLSQIFYLPIIWSITSLLTEVPSSYLADKWGRKKTMFLSLTLYLLYFVVYLFSENFWWFAIGTVIYSMSFSFFSGTDEALLYDTNKELGMERESLKKVGRYFSAQSVFKIITPIIGALLARNLTDFQFGLVFLIDIAITLIGVLLVNFLIEANHKLDLHKLEVGFFSDALKLLKGNYHLTRAIFNRMLVFIAMFMLWIYFQPFFVNRGISIVTIGFAWGIYHLIVYIANNLIHKVKNSISVERKINFLNLMALCALLLFILTAIVYPDPYILLVIFVIAMMMEVLRWPYFSIVFNRESHSYNRATTLSLVNFTKGVLDIPLLFLGAALIAKSELYPYFLSAAIVLLVVLLLPMRRYHNREVDGAGA